MAGIRVIAAPVVFTNNTGGGPDELQVPTTGEATRDFDVGSTVEAAWWVPLDNISDLPAIHMIRTNPNGTHVSLVVGGLPGHRNARVRIMIYASTV